MVLKHEIDKRLPDNHANLCRLTGIGPRQATGALEGDDFERGLEEELAGYGIGDDLLKVPNRDGPVYGDDGLGLIVGQHLAVVAIGQPLFTASSRRDKDRGGCHEVLAGPACIDVEMQGPRTQRNRPGSTAQAPSRRDAKPRPTPTADRP